MPYVNQWLEETSDNLAKKLESKNLAKKLESRVQARALLTYGNGLLVRRARSGFGELRVWAYFSAPSITV